LLFGNAPKLFLKNIAAKTERSQIRIIVLMDMIRSVRMARIDKSEPCTGFGIRQESKRKSKPIKEVRKYV
ncbi:hypothetical protein QUF80_23010, partial [Desulfococcaceae bacterium HSG8]|nr:hypothetical protein [Desulfococcaceae bacterium HSG8]